MGKSVLLSRTGRAAVTILVIGILLLGGVTQRALADTPTLTLSRTSATYVENDTGFYVDPGIQVVYSSTINGAKVSIGVGFSALQDQLLCSTPEEISGSYNATTGVLTLTGTASASLYQAALRAVRYYNSSDTPSTASRVITFSLSDGSLYYGGHYYEFVSDPGVKWSEAKTKAENRSLFGLNGYLATITSQQENDFLAAKVSGSAWIGASDAAVEGTWRWVTGPEAGSALTYTNWNAGEPNNSGGHEDYAHMMSWTDPPGRWNDLPDAGGSGDYASTGYMVEYGGMFGDPVVQLSQSITIAVEAVNDAPVITQGASCSVTMDEDNSPTPFSLTLNATDADSDAVSWRILTQALHGTAAASGTASSKAISYVPNADYNGSDSFVVQVSDDHGGTASTTVTVTIRPRNDLPINTVLPVATGTPHPGQTLSTTTGTWDDSHDSLAGTQLTYKYYWQRRADGSTWANIPDANGSSYAVASSDLGYQIRCAVDCLDHCDGNPPDVAAEAYSNIVTITNDAPVIIQGPSCSVAMSEDGSPTPFSLTLKATDADNDTLMWSILTGATHGTATASGTGASPNIGYTPTLDYYGSDFFVVRVSDGFGGTDDITVNVAISEVNDAPTAVGDTFNVVEDGTLELTADQLLANDLKGPANEAAQTLTVLGVGSSPVNCGVSMTGGVVTVHPDADFNGTASFTYTIQDNGTTAGVADPKTSIGTVTITVTAVNDAPSFTKGADQTVLEDCGAQTVNTWATAISAGPADESGQILNFIVSNNNNTLFSAQPAVSPAGILTWTPAANMNGSATVTVKIHDDGGTANAGVDTSAEQTFTITVTPVNDAPSFAKGADQTVLEDSGVQTVNIWATAISAGPADESGQILNFIVSNNNNTLFSAQPAVSPAGILTWTPAANMNGSATVTIQIHDDGGTANAGVDTSAAQTFTITVTPVNDPPTNTAAPVVSGIPHVGRTLSTTDGVWNDRIDTDVSGSSVLSYTYQWQRSTDRGVTFGDIPGATSPTYLLTLADNLQMIRSKVMCTDDGVGDPQHQTTSALSTPISVSILNAAPVITEGALVSAACDEDESPVAFTYVLHATDSDIIDTLTWHILTPPAHGTLTLPSPSAGSSMAPSVYHPAPNWNGVDSFTLQVEDGLTGTDEVTVTVTVAPVNDAPVNAVPPSVDGHFWVGDQLAGHAGQWNDSIDLHPGNLTLSYQWERARNATGTDTEAIAGATSLTYRVQGQDEGWFLRLVVTCTDDGETPPASMSTSVATNWTKAVYNDRQAPRIIVGGIDTLPDVSGYVAQAGTGPNDDEGEYWFTVRQSSFSIPFAVQDDRVDGVTWTVMRGKQVLASGLGLGGWNPAISLFEGSNDITVSATDAAGNTTKQFLHVVCDTQAPVVEFVNPVPTSVTSAVFALAGTVRDATTGVRSLTIDGHDVVPFSDGSFSATVTLKRGENTIAIESIDRVGNTYNQTVHIVYAPVSNVALVHAMQITIGSKTMSVDGMKVTLDAPAQIVQDRTLVPLRTIVEQLGGTISWNAKTRQVTLKARGTTMVLTIGKSTALVNGRVLAIDPNNSKVVPLLMSDRTMLPLRFVAENLGLQVDWNAKARMITLTWND